MVGFLQKKAVKLIPEIESTILLKDMGSLVIIENLLGWMGKGVSPTENITIMDNTEAEYYYGIMCTIDRSDGGSLSSTVFLTSRETRSGMMPDCPIGIAKLANDILRYGGNVKFGMNTIFGIRPIYRMKHEKTPDGKLIIRFYITFEEGDTEEKKKELIEKAKEKSEMYEKSNFW